MDQQQNLITVVLHLQAVALVWASSGENLVRKRREWILPPSPLMENVDYTQQESIAKIRSDYENEKNIEYFLEGIGANQEPRNVFTVNSKSGLIRVTQVLDRELIDTYNLSGVAKFNDGSHAEKKIDIRIKVEDQNDNAPVFGVMKAGEVAELSPAGTSVMKVIATDADEPGNENSQIAYSIIAQSPFNDMFYMSSDGTVFVKKMFSLDQIMKDKVDQYIVTVRGQDLNGKPGGNSATSTVTINIQDVNDNLPTLEKEKYEGSIEENTQGVEVMRLKSQDLDLKNTDNWEAVYDIVKGNEAGYFSIRTDPVTNEGILMLDKDVKDLDLGITVRNKAPPYGSGSSWQSVTTYKTYPVKINVKNQVEGPHFDPKVKAIPISEGGHSININNAIARYAAIDGDTGKQAENVRYAKGSDPDNWLTIDPKTADIKLNKMPDRESPFLVNGTYFAKILCISEDMPDKTATGTIAIQVEDFNDHCPTLTNNIQTMCTTQDAVTVSAKDADPFPNGPPFDFVIVPEGTQGKWQVEHLNTAAILRAQEHLWPGVYEVEFSVKDEQGLACPEPQKVQVQVCTCEDGVACGKRGASGQPSKETKLGPAGIGLLLLGLLLLLLIPLLLLFCQCGSGAGLPGGFTEMPFDTKSHLINYRTEGQGDNTSVTSMDGINGAQFSGGFAGGQMEEAWANRNQWNIGGSYHTVGRAAGGGGGGIYDGILTTWKASTESLLVYDYEGQGSSAGSVGCCSLLESDNDLQFLNDLGPKFKTLAEVCGGKTISTEVKQAFTPLPSSSMNTQTSISSLVTAPQLPTPPKLQPIVPKTEQTVVRETSEHSQVVNESTATVRGGMTTVKEGMANQGQMLLLQQPVYYTTAPMLQPMHYVVQPQVQNTVLLAEAPAANMQGMVLVNGTQTGPAQGVVVQGQTVMSSGQGQGPGMVLVERSGVQGGGTNLIQTGNLSGSQAMMVVEGKVPAGSMKVLKGSQTRLVQGGTLQSGGLSGSQRVLVVGEPTSSGGQLVQGAGSLSQKSDVSGSQRVLHSKGSVIPGSQSSVVGSSTTTVSTTPTYRKIVVQETKEIH
uniref:Cadherin domain-containing protein n=1 Tax=Monopterus albus TaxID=43700 RepID=A0A3Q3J0M2_MONAL